MKKICVVGAGRWGKNHIRTLDSLGCLGGIVESNPEEQKAFQLSYPEMPVYSNIKDVFQDSFDGFTLATPAETHLELGLTIMSEGYSVLIEKPLALNPADAKLLVEKADEMDVTLMVGHVLLFHPAIRKMKSLIDEGRIGDIQYIYSNRLNLGTVRKEENVFWSFAPHDISIFQYFIESEPIKVSSNGAAFLQDNIYDTSLTSLTYANNIHGHIFVSWLHPFKEHRLVVSGSKGMIRFEDSAENKPLLFYEKDSNPDMELLSLKNKPSRKIEYEQSLPLTNELKYFIDVVRGKQIDKATIEEGINVVKILEMATNSLSIPTNSKSPGSKLARRNARRGR